MRAGSASEPSKASSASGASALARSPAAVMVGGAAGAAVLGAVFAAQAAGPRPEIAEAVQTVFLAAAPLAALGALIVLLLDEVPLAERLAPARG